MNLDEQLLKEMSQAEEEASEKLNKVEDDEKPDEKKKDEEKPEEKPDGEKKDKSPEGEAKEESLDEDAVTEENINEYIDSEWVSLEEMKEISPSCAAKMEEAGLTKIKLSVLDEKKDEDGWPASKELKRSSFTAYCKRLGFDGPNLECAEKAMKSPNKSIRGKASFYKGVVKSDTAKSEKDVDEKCGKPHKKMKKGYKKEDVKEDAKSLSPVNIQILEQGDNENEYYEIVKSNSVRSEAHIISAVRKALREAMKKLGKDFDSIEVAFRREAIEEKKEETVTEATGKWPPKDVDKYVGSEVIVDLVGKGTVRGKFERDGDGFAVTIPAGIKKKFRQNDITRFLVKNG